MMTIDEARQDLETLRTVAGGLKRGRDSIYVLLTAIYRTGRKWIKEQVSPELREAILKREGNRVDARVKRNRFRLLIELTCDEVNVKIKSRYANALRYAHQNDCPATEFTDFIKRNGTIEATARKFRLERNDCLKRTKR